jgi:hypothetical protein
MNKYYLFYLIIILLILIAFLFYKKNYNENFDNNNNNGVSLKIYQDIISSDKDHKNIYKPHIPLKEIKYEDCERQCNAKDCIIMREMKKTLDKCFKCKAEGKCFKKTIIGGNCDDCMKGETPIDCLRTDNFGCTNPANFNSFNGSYPYYFELQDFSVTSPLDQKCVFCWQIEDQI